MLKIRKETSWFTFFVVLFTGIIEVAIGAILICNGCMSLGSYLLQEGFDDIQNSIDYIQGKTDIKLGEWVKGKSINFVKYIVTSLIPGGAQLSQGINALK